ncbi:protein adenylyltransferase SelO [Crenobacter cavernae]|uniref:Protein nucleotidyltransferase YdiU n=1 Tax=Crenobacter cavernae TaxID=2290923 RepID=A0ABY0FCG1_9NEIS|nr:YdiU family protein [Crenobacter cavernae]RXZ42479.1 YdiU family protein [Crenobacter cavernae]
MKPHPFASLPQRYATLPPRFYRAVEPTALPDPYLVHLNESLALELGLDAARLAEPDGVALLTGSAKVEPTPLATVYSGHQFGVWAGQLGDGRALMFGEWRDLKGRDWEIQIKGAGLTPFSRMGDGRAVLRSSIREYLCSEAMAGLNIPTTRALAVTGSNSPVYRETVETAAVVTRVSESFLRFGHFEHCYHRGDEDGVRELADFTIRHHYPELQGSANPYAALIDAVIARTASLMADWQAVGFCHGVMNTDNMSILGLTIDYGPYGFLDAFDAAHICNHSDHAGRYAYGQQPQVAQWNLNCLASAFLPLVTEAELVALLRGYQRRFETAYLAKIRAKLGFAEAREGDVDLAEKLLLLMHANRVDYTIFWRRLSGFDALDGALNESLRDLFLDREGFDAWAVMYRERLSAEVRPAAERKTAMDRVNPKYVLRNHLAETAIRKAREGDFSEVDRLLSCLARPFDDAPEFDDYAAFPPDWAGELSVSCSS